MKIGIQLGCFDACLDVRCCIHGLPLILESACQADTVPMRDPYGGAVCPETQAAILSDFLQEIGTGDADI